MVAPLYVYTPQPVLVTLAMAQQRLRVIFVTSQPEIQNDLTAIVQQASDAVRNYLKSANDPTWTDTSAPPVVQAAVLTLAACWWTHKGDDSAPQDYDAGAWKQVERLLMQIRDPALA